MGRLNCWLDFDKHCIIHITILVISIMYNVMCITLIARDSHKHAKRLIGVMLYDMDDGIVGPRRSKTYNLSVLSAILCFQCIFLIMWATAYHTTDHCRLYTVLTSWVFGEIPFALSKKTGDVNKRCNNQEPCIRKLWGRPYFRLFQCEKCDSMYPQKSTKVSP